MSRKRATPGIGYRRDRRGQQQTDLFTGGQWSGAIDVPAWTELPAEARSVPTGLMTQLILDHAARTATPPAKEVGHDL